MPPDIPAMCMEAFQLGLEEGLKIAQQRIDCDFYRSPMTWDEVWPQLLEFERDRVLDG